MSAVRVKLNKGTRWGQRFLPAGSEVLVGDDVARRWQGNGLAEVLGREGVEEGQEDARFRYARSGSSSWYDILDGEEVLERVQGKASAQAAVEALREAEKLREELIREESLDEEQDDLDEPEEEEHGGDGEEAGETDESYDGESEEE